MNFKIKYVFDPSGLYWITYNILREIHNINNVGDCILSMHTTAHWSRNISVLKKGNVLKTICDSFTLNTFYTYIKAQHAEGWLLSCFKMLAYNTVPATRNDVVVEPHYL